MLLPLLLQWDVAKRIMGIGSYNSSYGILRTGESKLVVVVVIPRRQKEVLESELPWLSKEPDMEI